MTKIIYLDNGATTRVDPEVLKAMWPYFTEAYGNAASLHAKGIEAKDALEKARKVIAKSINAESEEIIFTSGGTEANNLAIKGIAFNNKDKGNHIITTNVEHKCVSESCKWLETQGFTTTYLGVNKEGFVNLDELKKAITPKTILVSIIHGNNEIGTINDLYSIGQICKKQDLCFHTDACQSYTKTELDIKKMNLDLVTINAHKIHGPKGVGALFIKKGTKIKQWQHGGAHEFNLRAGTENIPGVTGFAKAVELAQNKKHVEYMIKLRDKLISNILRIPDVILNGPIGNNRLCNNANFSFKGIEGEAIGGYLDSYGVCSSTGSACSSLKLEPSHVLKAIGRNNEEANGSLRLTLSRFTTEEEIDFVLEKLPYITDKLRSFSPIYKVINRVLKKSD
ncbi:MAG: cysteine desulfurase NifS [Candidatus Diapherotrites archaeon CG08_land_8_20_14_0_20_30_16]|nr:MAG: cysteine desulfurase NifS [Candidatus Diapherotrites archaeon CG08_land_8_20_14_0_20_30_16]